MKGSINRVIQIGTMIVISCVVVYGFVYAQQICCSTITEVCIVASNRISVSCNINNSWRTSPSHYLNNQLLLGAVSNDFLSDCDAGNTCCQTDRCDNANQVIYCSLPSIQDCCPIQKDAIVSDSGSTPPATGKPYSLLTSLRAVPIYILTQSIIC